MNAIARQLALFLFCAACAPALISCSSGGSGDDAVTTATAGGTGTVGILLTDKPADFSWTRTRRYVADDRTAIATIHLHDGVIRRSWYRGGEIVERHDLNVGGKATRRLFYRDGKLARREYHNRDDYHVSTELFDADGYHTESIQHGSRPRQWWYEKGVPVKYTRGSDTYVEQGQRWIKTK